MAICERRRMASFFIVLYADDGTAHTEGTLEDLDADEDLVGLAHHQGGGRW